MHEVRLAFLAAAGTARTALGLADVAERWNEESALPRMTIGALAAHLARAITTLETYLATSVRHGDEEPMSAAAYFASINAVPADLDSELNVGVRERAAEGAKPGSRAVLESFEKSLAHLQVRLQEEPDDRRVEVYGKYVLLLDEYLLTRIVELTIHTDDLYVSTDRTTPTLPGIGPAIRTLVDCAELRHGEIAVLRALARRERDSDEALRVL